MFSEIENLYWLRLVFWRFLGKGDPPTPRKQMAVNALNPLLS